MTLSWFIGVALAVGCGEMLFWLIVIYLIRREIQMHKDAVDTVKQCLEKTIKDVKTVNVKAQCGPIKFDFDINV